MAAPRIHVDDYSPMAYVAGQPNDDATTLPPMPEGGDVTPSVGGHKANCESHDGLLLSAKNAIKSARSGREEVDHMVVRYEFGSALFSRALYFVALSGILTFPIAAYVLGLVFVATLAGLAACPQTTPAPPAWSILLGSGGCWTNFQLTWSELTLLPLTSFLLALLASSMAARWWSTRLLLQDAVGAGTQLFMGLKASLTPGAETDHAEAVAIVAAIKRRLLLSFGLTLSNVGYDGVTLDSLAAEGLLTPAEATALHGHRSVNTVAGWLLRDVTVLVDRGWLLSPGPTLGNLNNLLARVRTTLVDLPVYVNVQLPFPVVSLTAVVVHLCIWQMTYISTSYIGSGFATPGMGMKALSGYFTLVVVPFVFLSVLRLQAMLSNPFGHEKTDFPVYYLLKAYAANLDALDASLSEATIASVGEGRPPPPTTATSAAVPAAVAK